MVPNNLYKNYMLHTNIKKYFSHSLFIFCLFLYKNIPYSIYRNIKIHNKHNNFSGRKNLENKWTNFLKMDILKCPK